MSLADLNKLAEDKFKKIKQDKGYDNEAFQASKTRIYDNELLNSDKFDFTREDFERPIPQFVKEMKERGLHPIPVPTSSKKVNYEPKSLEIDEQKSMLDAILTFTDSLDISNNLKLAICNLISLDSKQGKEFSELLRTTYNLIGEERIHSK